MTWQNNEKTQQQAHCHKVTHLSFRSKEFRLLSNTSRPYSRTFLHGIFLLILCENWSTPFCTNKQKSLLHINDNNKQIDYLYYLQHFFFFRTPKTFFMHKSITRKTKRINHIIITWNNNYQHTSMKTQEKKLTVAF